MKIVMKRDCELCDAKLSEGDVVAQIEIAEPLNLPTLVDAIRNGYAGQLVEVSAPAAPAAAPPGGADADAKGETAKKK